MPREQFIDRMDRAIDSIKGCRRRPGVEEILIPGERSHRTGEANRERGVPVEGATIAEVEKLCAELKVPFILGRSAALSAGVARPSRPSA